jgi:hypothetical protein
MLRYAALTVVVTLSLGLLTTLAIPGQSTAQSDSSATPSSTSVAQQTGGAIPASAPNFSAAGITTKVVSISKTGTQIALALMFQNTNTYPVRTALVNGSFSIVDDKGQFMRPTALSGMQGCGVGRSPDQILNSCLEPKNPKDSAYLAIDPGASVIVNMSLSGKVIGDTVTLAGMLVVFPMVEEKNLSAKQSQPDKGRAINISIPLIPVQ